MRIEIVDITPSIASAMLDKNISNRKLRKTAVESLATAMKSGLFQTTHQGIAFNCDGYLIDGQHRLHAIIKSGATVKMVVAYDVEAADYAALMIDCGANRRASDLYRKSRDVTECAGALYVIHTGAHYTNKTLLGPYIDTFEDVIDKLSGVSNTHKKGLGSAFRAAAVVRIAENPNNTAYCLDLIGKMSRYEYETLPKVANDYLRGVQSGTISGSNLRRLFAKAMIVFSPDKANAGVLRAYDSVIAEAASIIDTKLSQGRR